MNSGDLPKNVTLIEVGPRDGFQMEKTVIPTQMKVEIIDGLVAAGFKHIQVTAFVHPGRVPQLADAETLVKALAKHPDVIYNALVLNTRGLNRALAAGMSSVEISVSASDTHSRKNAGVTHARALEEALAMIRTAQKNGCQVRAGIQCAFGCAYEGSISQPRVLEMASCYLSEGIDMLAIADTTGMGTPEMMTDLLEKILPLAGDVPVVLHLHDTKGLGLANVMAAMTCGVTHFDTALGGLGGCPFIPGAPGNIGTEKTVDMLHRMKIETGIDSALVTRCAERVLSLRHLFC
jgi:hydroxymethylglutaryl-CoA lyase